MKQTMIDHALVQSAFALLALRMQAGRPREEIVAEMQRRFPDLSESDRDEITLKLRQLSSDLDMTYLVTKPAEGNA